MLKIYLTDLAAYNKGYLLGEWITLPCDDLESKLNKILSSGEALCFVESGYFEKHEEYFITDWEWEDNELFKLTEYENIFELNSKLTEVSNLDEESINIVAFLLNQGLACDIDDAISKKDDVVIYYNSSMQTLAYDLIEECYDLNTLPSIISNHIDYESIARDLMLEGNYFEIDGDIYEYRN